MANKRNLLPPMKYVQSLCLILLTIISHFPCRTASFTPKFVWAAVNKTIEEDRLSIVDANNDKVRIKSCAKLVLYNQGSSKYLEGNHSGSAILVDVTYDNFSTPELVDQIKDRIEQINLGICVPCIVVISMVNISSSNESNFYGKADINYLTQHQDHIQNHKVHLSRQLTDLLQFKTPIQARHLILVRLVEKYEDLTKCHGKRYTKYPRRLVPLWEQILFDHFKEARVIQGATGNGGSETVLTTGKENGIWVWMCEEIIRRLDLQDECRENQVRLNRDLLKECMANLTTASVDMSDINQCGLYRPRS